MPREYVSSVDTESKPKGLPPHAWGIPFHVCFTRYDLRITPTYVGNTLVIKNGALVKLGLPPHAWGILAVAHLVVH